MPSVVSFQEDNLFCRSRAKKYQLTDSNAHRLFDQASDWQGMDDLQGELPLMPYKVTGHGREIVKIEVRKTRVHASRNLRLDPQGIEVCR